MNLTEHKMLEALNCLDRILDRKIKLIIGGGGAVILNHYFSMATTDIDAVPASGITIEQLDVFIKKVAETLNIAPDWLNPYYSTFTHVLPNDYGSRLQSIGHFKNIEALVLSKEDLMIMKCFAGRTKDRSHARALIKVGIDTSIVERHLQHLQSKNIPGAGAALDFFDEVVSE